MISLTRSAGTRPVTLRAIVLLAALQHGCGYGCAGARASSLASTQFRGLIGVNLTVDVAAAFGDRRGPLETAIRKRVKGILITNRIGEHSAVGQYLEIEVDVLAAITAGANPVRPIHIGVRLREPVLLKRDRAIEVPGGGALVWWRDTYDSVPEAKLTDVVLDHVEDLVRVFADEVRSMNP